MFWILLAFIMGFLLAAFLIEAGTNFQIKRSIDSGYLIYEGKLYIIRKIDMEDILNEK